MCLPTTPHIGGPRCHWCCPAKNTEEEPQGRRGCRMDGSGGSEGWTMAARAWGVKLDGRRLERGRGGVGRRLIWTAQVRGI
jgi:hypothetical protein